jgi:hypothetical protein
MNYFLYEWLQRYKATIRMNIVYTNLKYYTDIIESGERTER